MVERKEYLERLEQWRGEQVIKVVTGIRRCGKSTLLRQYQQRLKDSGVLPQQIISINFEELENEALLDYRTLHDYIKERLTSDKITYIFLDEIQNVPSFEKAVDSLYVKPNVDLYLTGSNSYLLSGDLATLLSGRYIEIKMLPLSFCEFLEMTHLDKEQGFSEFLRWGAMPYVAAMDKSRNIQEKADTYLEGIYNTVIVHDIEDRYARRASDSGKRSITNISLLKLIAKYLAGVVGSSVSVRNITNFLASSGRSVSPHTVDLYLEALTESFVFYPVERFDVQGKQTLKTNKKFYVVDLGLRNYMLPRQNYDLGFSLENLVYLELVRRGYEVFVGKVGATEVDFIAKKQGVYTYIQVTADMTSQATFEREMHPLRNIKDNYEKMVLTADRLTLGNYGGIEVNYLLDWLLD